MVIGEEVKNSRGGGPHWGRREESRFEAARMPREGWKEAEDATASACLLSSQGIWMRETEGKGARKERHELAMDWREESAEKEELDRKERKERESPKMVRGVEGGREGKERKKGGQADKKSATFSLVDREVQKGD